MKRHLEYNAKFEKKWDNPSIETLKAMGQSTFLVQCAPCHVVLMQKELQGSS